MAKFKKGQKVRLVNLKAWLGGEYFPSKSNKVGNVGTITRVYYAGEKVSHYKIRWSNGTENHYVGFNLVPLIMEENE